MRPYRQNSPRSYSDVSVMHAVSRVPSSRPHPMPSRIATGMKSISHANTRVSHGVYASAGSAGPAAADEGA